MNRIRSLIAKEKLQHLGAIFILSIILALGGVVLFLNASYDNRLVSLIETEVWFLAYFIPLAAMVLAHRLVVTEYYGHTQLFIEALPIRRSEMVMVKYALGLAYIACMTVISLTVVSLLASASEPMGGLFICILLLRSLVFVFFIWSFFFAMGFLGRFRIPAYIIMGFLVSIVLYSTELEFSKISPCALVDPTTYPFERNTVPVFDLIVTFLAGMAWGAVALFLSLVREGSLAESLAQRMTQREKAMLGILVIGFMLALAFLEEKREKAPYQFNANEVVESRVLPVKILYMAEPVKPDAITLLRHLETKLSGMKQALNLASLPSLRIAHRSSLDKKTFETATLNESDGVLVRANIRALDGGNREDLTTYIVKAVLDHLTNNRSRFEPKRWLHDGFARWWALEGVDAHDRILLRTFVALRHQELSVDEMKKWMLFRERNGEFLSEAVACSGLLFLQEEKGADAVIGLAREVFGRIPSDDFRETVYETFHPLPRIFHEATGETWARFISNWRTWLDRQQQSGEILARLEAIPDIRGRVWIESKEGGIRDISYSFIADHAADKKIAGALLHEKLTPFDDELNRADLNREEAVVGLGEAAAVGHLMGRYGAGDRVFVALEYDSDELDIPIRIFSQRMNLP